MKKAVKIGRPRLPESQKAQRVNITLYGEDIERLTFLCEKHSISRGRMIAQLIAAKYRTFSVTQ